MVSMTVGALLALGIAAAGLVAYTLYLVARIWLAERKLRRQKQQWVADLEAWRSVNKALGPTQIKTEEHWW